MLTVRKPLTLGSAITNRPTVEFWMIQQPGFKAKEIGQYQDRRLIRTIAAWIRCW
jgi:hypothetical protein